ncbi:MAG: radical SAM protein [Lachnospiraceae bacterium]|nr:radical SAM protein [Lachnospiraceae bacterium]MDD3796654.1 radical SAM protein [Lachnospiraceae bacterium]
MGVIEKKILTKDYLTKSNLPASDFVINPYVGCPHACKYCYARFMKRFTAHTEEWGDFIDIKYCNNPINLKKLKGKSLFLSSVTDCYNQYESKYGITRNILEQLVDADCQITISTKSDLIVRDIDILKRFPRLKVALSLNTLDEQFRSDMDKGSTVLQRWKALEQLHEAGIYTVLFMSPIFPYITDWEKIIEKTKNMVDEYWFENLNLRGAYKQTILSYIDQWYPNLSNEYRKIYIHKDNTYWEDLAKALNEYCEKAQLNYVNYFYHNELVKQKVNKKG